jgi:protein tyrosine phosphatase (PTP) superfamily phosphohydrolase (DUF442 family)
MPQVGGGSEMTVPRVTDRKPASTAATTEGAPIGQTGRQILWRKTKRAVWGWRQGLIARTPPWVRRTFGPLFWYADMLLVDHGVFRLIYVNRHRLGGRAWRSAQPTPRHIRALRRRGLRTIVNLRGERLCGSYWLEQRACERKGIAMINFQLRSRAAPTREEIKGARELFERIEYPVLFHCKSGADRVGLMSALYPTATSARPTPASSTASSRSTWRTTPASRCRSWSGSTRSTTPPSCSARSVPPAGRAGWSIRC